jgi:hypothetical protein
MWGKCGLNPQTKNRKHFIYKGLRFCLVRMKGLEPPRLTAPDPKSGAAANYATSAVMDGKDNFFCFQIEFLIFEN